jgi:hypothetical protein
METMIEKKGKKGGILCSIRLTLISMMVGCEVDSEVYLWVSEMGASSDRPSLIQIVLDVNLTRFGSCSFLWQWL